MKKVNAILLILLLYFSVLSAQNYQTVNSNRIAYFSNASGNIKCIRIDTVTWMGLIPFKNIQEISLGCFTPYGPSWIGEGVGVTESEDHFSNKNNQTITIKTNALLNESWTAYDLYDSTKIVATVIDMGITPSYLGLRDWIKEIGFQAYSRNMVPKDHPVNEMTIIISENYGFFKTLNFYLFPDISNEYPPEQLEEYDLVGLSDPQVGIQNLTWFAVYDFQVGDEIHIQYESNEILCGGINGKSRIIDKYISRSDYLDSIVYMVNREQIIEEYSPKNTLEHSHDTIRTTITKNAAFDYLPGEPIISDYGASAYTMTNGFELYKTEPSAPVRIWLSEDSCWTNCCWDGGYCYCNYIKGLGGPYCDCENYFMCFGTSSNRIVYYKKGDKTWGTPLNMSDIPDIYKNPEIEIYPNPAGEKISIKIPSSDFPAIFELIDLGGKILLQKEINAEVISINLDENLKGIFLYRIVCKGEVFEGKVVIR